MPRKTVGSKVGADADHAAASPVVGAAARSGSEWATILAERHWNTLVRYAAGRLGPYSAAGEDVVVDALTLILEGRIDLAGGDQRLVAKTCAVIRNLCMRELRQRSKLQPLNQQLPDRTLPADWELAEHLQRKRQLLHALDLLTTGERSVIRQHYLLGRSIREIADSRRCTVATVKELIRRGRRKLRAHLRP